LFGKFENNTLEKKTIMNKYLTQLFSEFLGNQAGSYIWDQVFPTIESSSTYFNRLIGNQVQKLPSKDDLIIAGDAEAKTLPKSAVSDEQEKTQKVAFTITFNEDDLEKAYKDGQIDSPDNVRQYQEIQLEQSATYVNIMQEKEAADALFSSSNYDSDTYYNTPVADDKWSAKTDGVSTSNPIQQLITGIQAVEDGTGITPNTLTMGNKAFRNFAGNTIVKDYLFGKDAATPAPDRYLEALKAHFNLDDVFVGKARYDSTVYDADESMGLIWGDYAALYYKDNVAVNTRTPNKSFGVRVAKKGQRAKVLTYQKNEKTGNPIWVIELVHNDVLLTPSENDKNAYLIINPSA
jgi:dsDNA-binding SOS-regulon protein